MDVKGTYAVRVTHKEARELMNILARECVCYNLYDALTSVPHSGGMTFALIVGSRYGRP